MNEKFQALVNHRLKFDLAAVDALSFIQQKNDDIYSRAESGAIRGRLLHDDFLNRKYRYKINASVYEVDLKNGLELLIEELGLSADISAASQNLLAPMPGLVVDILVKPGDDVKKGDGLLVLEAMKMENKLVSANDAIIKSIQVRKGDTVEKNMVLIEFESHEEN